MKGRLLPWWVMEVGDELWQCHPGVASPSWTSRSEGGWVRKREEGPRPHDPSLGV